jgi:hypothetical protein
MDFGNRRSLAGMIRRLLLRPEQKRLTPACMNRIHGSAEFRRARAHTLRYTTCGECGNKLVRGRMSQRDAGCLGRYTIPPLVCPGCEPDKLPGDEREQGAQ